MNYASSCILWHVTLDDIHITGVPEANYTEIQKKWKKHLPLGKKTGNPLEDVKLIFPAMFNGQVGLFEEASLKLSPEAKLVQLPPRAMPQSILPKLRKELDKMKTKWIFQTCPETTDWVHNLVTSQEEWYTSAMPRPQKSEQASHQECALHCVMGRCTAQLQEWAVLFNSRRQIWILDETSWQGEPATYRFKKYCFVRLPFGLSVSSEIFCKHMDQALDGIPGTFPCADDVKMQGPIEERDDLHLLETVAKAQKAGLRFNPDKYSMKKHQIEYFGRVISSSKSSNLPLPLPDRKSVV